MSTSSRTRYHKGIFYILLFAITFAWTFANSETVLSGDAVRLRATTIPASCTGGQMRLSSSDNKIKFCGGSTFDEVLTLTGSGTITNKLFHADDGASSGGAFAFDADTDTGIYRSGTDTLDIIAGSYTGLQVKKSTGNFANVGMGTSASTSDQVLLSMQRSNASAGTYAIASNTSTSANAFGGFRAEGDNGAVVGQFASYTAASTVDAYVSAAVLRASGSATKLTLAGPTIKFYTNNAVLTTAEEALRLNPDFSMQLMQTIATPATPSANSLKVYVKNDKLYTLNDSGSELELGSGSGGGSAGINLLGAYNPGGEAAATTNWTESGSGTLAIESTAANVGNGTYSISFDAAAASDYLASNASTVVAGLYGANCLLDFYYKGFDSNITAQVHDGTNVVASQALTAATTFQRVQLNFVCPSSGTLQFRLLAAADAAIGYVDEVHLGSASNISNVTQAQFVGSSYFAGTAACVWQRTSTTMGDFSTDTDCPGPTVEFQKIGTWATTDANLPQQTITGLPPGLYEVTFEIPNFMSTSSSQSAFTISDGTTTSGRSQGEYVTSSESATTVTGFFEYTTAGDRTFELNVSSSAGTVNVPLHTNLDRRLTISIKRWPLSSEQAVNSSNMAQSWSGYHDSTCSWARTNAAYGAPTDDASCALAETSNMNFGTVSTSGSVSPAITFTPKAAATYFICAKVAVSAATNAAAAAARLYDGTTQISEGGTWAPGAGSHFSTTLCGLYKATSATAKTISVQTRASTGAITISAAGGAGISDRPIEWSIFRVDQNFSAPVLVGSVTSNSTGAERIERALLNCDSSSAITSQSGSWVSSIGNISSAVCTVTIASGIFSAAPTCVATQSASTGAIHVSTSVASATSFTIGGIITNTVANATTYDAHVVCIGPR